MSWRVFQLYQLQNHFRPLPKPSISRPRKDRLFQEPEEDRCEESNLKDQEEIFFNIRSKEIEALRLAPKTV